MKDTYGKNYHLPPPEATKIFRELSEIMEEHNIIALDSLQTALKFSEIMKDWVALELDDSFYVGWEKDRSSFENVYTLIERKTHHVKR